MFWSFRGSFDVDAVAFLATFSKIGQNFNVFSGHTDLKMFFVTSSTFSCCRLRCHGRRRIRGPTPEQPGVNVIKLFCCN
jgi:hypothetical protein